MKQKGFNLLEIIIVLAIICTLIFIIIASRLKVGSKVKVKSTGDSGIITEVLNSKCEKQFVVKTGDKEIIVSINGVCRG